MANTTKTIKKVVAPGAETEFPSWFRDYQRAFRGGANLFNLTGDVYGNFRSGIPWLRWLQEVYYVNNMRDIILTLSLANGFQFYDELLYPDPELRRKARPNGEMRQLAKELLKLKRGSAPQPNPAAAAMMGGGAPPDPFSFNPEKPSMALNVIKDLLTQHVPNDEAKSARGRVAVIIEQAELFCPAGTEKGVMTAEQKLVLSMLFTWGHDHTMGQAACPIFLASRNIEELHPDLRSSDSGTKMLNIPLPDRKERLAYLTRYLADRAEDGKPIELVGIDVEDFANATAGLNLRHLEDICLLGTVDGVTRELVIERKTDIIQNEFSAIAEPLEPLEGGFDSMGGMPHIIEWARERLIGLLRAGSTSAPNGILLVGPPGTGKTRLVSALAYEAKFNCIKLDMSKITTKWVGESERNLRAFFELTEAVAPCFVFVDEIDQSDIGNRSGGENPVGRNLFGMMLQQMSKPSNRGKIVFIMATNMPRNLDAALKRSGRVKYIIPVMLPRYKERLSILRVQARIQEIGISDEAVEFAANATDRWNGGDLASLVEEAKELAELAGHTRIELDDITEARENLTPESPATADYYEGMAIEACNNKRFLPPEDRTTKDDEKLTEKVTTEGQRIATMRGERTERESW